MNYDIDRLRAAFGSDSSETEQQWLERMKRDYPFFPLPECLDMRRKWDSMTPSERETQLAGLAVRFPGNIPLERIIEADGERFDGFYPEQASAPAPTTNRAIEKFLDTYGSGDTSEIETLEKLIFNPVADYSQQLAREEEASLPDETPSGDSQEDRINRFILAVRGKERSADGSHADDDQLLHESEAAATQKPAGKNTQPRQRGSRTVAAPTPAPDNSLLSESLAKIYIKTHRYERAYEILERLSLAFPEKSAYFADQLRFLRKLMFIERRRGTRNGENE